MKLQKIILLFILLLTMNETIIVGALASPFPEITERIERIDNKKYSRCVSFDDPKHFTPAEAKYKKSEIEFCITSY